ncbi:MAG: sugar phosphate nucleotidyltransferase [Nitrososphaeria archaeon]
MMAYSLSSVKAIIPVGGEAVRLRPLTYENSKATVRLLNRPLIEHTLVELTRQGIKEIIFGVRGYVNYKSLFDYYKEGIGFSARYGVNPRVHFKYMPRYDSSGNADAVRVCLEYYDVKEDFFVVQGDNVFCMNLKRVLEYHRKNRAFMTVVLKEVENVEDFGVAALKKGRIEKFVEKPKKEEAPSNLANTGIYVISPEIRSVFKSKEFEPMIKEGKMDFGKDVIPYLISSGYKVMGYVSRSLWFDVGTPERYLETMKVMMKKLGAEGLKAFRIKNGKDIFVQGTSPDSRKRRATIKNMYEKGELDLEGEVLIGRHASIGNGTKIVNSNVDNFTVIGESVQIEGSTVMDRSVIGDYAFIKDSILGRHVEVKSFKEKPTRIERSVIADDVTIGEGSELVEVKVAPHRTISSGSKLYSTTIV